MLLAIVSWNTRRTCSRAIRRTFLHLILSFPSKTYSHWFYYSQKPSPRRLGCSEPLIVSPEPEIRVFSVDSLLDSYIVMASDGLWDALSSKRVVRLIYRFIFIIINSNSSIGMIRVKFVGFWFKLRILSVFSIFPLRITFRPSFH